MDLASSRRSSPAKSRSFPHSPHFGAKFQSRVSEDILLFYAQKNNLHFLKKRSCKFRRTVLLYPSRRAMSQHDKVNIRVWRSLVSRLNGVQEAAGSNPVTRTKKALNSKEFSAFLLLFTKSKTSQRQRNQTAKDSVHILCLAGMVFSLHLQW